ncbi:ornithine cyclodeaminase family protein [Streptomyces sp. NPDC056323]|uniref:ornithine cyclodeaminase family protein n=1 Tax=Streptomyces sp. NPDC056323 TaxID=3345784 RepID=UPI0035D62881
MPPLVFNDDDVRDRLDAATAVRAVRCALLAHHGGTLYAPPRARADLGQGDLVFTAGHLSADGRFGFRAYDTFAGAEQLVAVWDTDSRALRVLVHGSELGARRTGAIGAVDAAARPGPLRVGVIGTGVQAWTQLWALCAVRTIEDVAVTSRKPQHAEDFTRRASEELGVAARLAPQVRDAVSERDVVIVATNSTEPVLDAEWISAGTHVTTLGPKTLAHHEVPGVLADRAHLVLTDSRAQAINYPEPHLVDPDRMVELGALLAGAVPGRTSSDQVSLFCSVGLAGTEVAVASAFCDTIPQ